MVAFPAPTTAGISSARATMAVWLVMPPASVTSPATLRSWKRMAVSAGERSRATTMEPGGGVSTTSTPWPSRFFTMRSPT